MVVAFGVAYHLNRNNDADFEVVDQTIANDANDSVLVQENQDQPITEESINLSDAVIEEELEETFRPRGKYCYRSGRFT